MKQSQHQIDRFVFNDSDFLGEGSYGKVYKGTDTKTQKKVAIKILDMALFTDPFMIEALKTEISVMKELKSDHVVQMLDCYQNSHQTIIVLELCNGGDLRKFLDEHGGALDEATAVSVLQQLMNGFEEMIKHEYIHRDIKPENALIHDGTHKVADFGFATKCDIHAKQLMQVCVGTPLYMAPQLLQRRPYTAKSDIWSIGIMAYEIIYGRQPWPCRDENSYLRNMMNIPLKFPIQKEVSEEYKNFVRECLKVDETERIGWHDVFKHPILHKKISERQYVRENIDQRTQEILRSVQQAVQARNLNIAQIFESFDNDKGGKLDRGEFYNFLLSLDYRITASEATHVFQQIDSDNDGTLSFEEFKRIFLNYDFDDLKDVSGRIIRDLQEIVKANKINIHDIFNNFDADKRGTLDISEFSNLIRKIAPGIKQNDVEKAFKGFDQNGDGNIDFEEFRRALSYGIPDQDSKYNPQKEKATKLISELQRIVKSYNVDIGQIFANFDKDHNGKMGTQEFFQLCQVIDKNVHPEEATLVFQTVDANNDGSILVDEFRKLFI